MESIKTCKGFNYIGTPQLLCKRIITLCLFDLHPGTALFHSLMRKKERLKIYYKAYFDHKGRYGYVGGEARERQYW